MKKLAKRSLLAVAALVIGVFGLAAIACSEEKPTPEPEYTPVPYYCDLAGDEYTLTLYGKTFSFTKNETVLSGSCKTDGEGNLTFNFGAGVTVTATVYDGWLNMTYDDLALRFYETKMYTVEYDTDGGTAIESKKIKNGKTLSKPEDPTRASDLFVGWYADASYSAPFMFDTQPVTSDITLYARFEQNADISARTYTVAFDLGYDGATNPPVMQTFGGRLYGVSDPVREGYVFDGWYVSMAGKGEDGKPQLSYKYSEETVFTENTTLYALWHAADSQKLPSPAVSVAAGEISWQSVGTTANRYEVTITGPGNYSKTEQVTGISYALDFTKLPAGDYTVSVVAKSSAGASSDSEPAVRVYRNKALSRVSLFEVDDDSNLLYNDVDADKYLITVACGDSGHTHTLIDNKKSLYYNFSNCPLREDGTIEFTVTAEKAGYASSVSEKYVYYDKKLSPIAAIKIDENNDTVSWSPVDRATEYYVSVRCSNPAHEHSLVSVGNKTSYSFKECGAGEITVNVYPAAKGYWSPAPISAEYTKASVAAPSELKIVGNELRWGSVVGAESYIVNINGTPYAVESGTTFDLAREDLEWSSDLEYVITVQSVASGKASQPSESLDAGYYAWTNCLSYSANVVTWKYALGADSYEVRVNLGEIQTYTGVNSAFIRLTRSGENTIYVRYNDGGLRSAWATVKAYAYTAVFDTSGVEGTVDPQYVAFGDSLDLSVGTELSQPGYEFDAWYNAPGGASSNAKRYTDGLFTGTSDIVLYANYTPRTYTVTLDYNEHGTGSKTTMDIVFNSNDYTIPVPEAESPVYGFVGWYSNSGKDGIRFTDETGKAVGRWQYAQNVTVYAGWREVLSFTEENGYYVVSQGADAADVTTITVPATYQGPDDTAPLTVKVIGDTAFSKCTKLVTINIPNSVTNISAKAFRSCTALEYINIYGAEGFNEYVYESDDGVLLLNNQQTGVKDMWFYPRARMDELYTIPEGVVNLPTECFYYPKFKELVIPATVASVQTDFAYSATNLTKVTFASKRFASDEDVPLDIRPCAFRKATNLTTILLPARYDEFDSSIFYSTYTSKLTTVEVEEGGRYSNTADGMLYEKTSEGNVLVFCPWGINTDVTIDSIISVIGSYAFGGSRAKTVTIPNTVRTIRDFAFAGYKMTVGSSTVTVKGCTMTAITFEGGGILPLTIGKSAFGSAITDGKIDKTTMCTSLKTVNFDDDCNVTTIGERAFASCPIVTIELPNSVIELKDEAFADCTKMTGFDFAEATGELDLKKSLTIGDDCFYGCTSLTTIKLPYYVTEFNDGAFGGCTKLANVEVDERNPALASVDGVLFNKDISEIKFYSAVREGEYTLPASVTKIGSGVFQGRTGLTKINIGSKIAEISANAFKGCTNLTTVKFLSETAEEPEAQAEEQTEQAKLILGASAFEGCSKLSSINLPTNLVEIPDKLFYGCKLLANFTLPDGITAIGAQAFYDCDLLVGDPVTKKLVIPNTVEFLGYGAFQNCDGLLAVEFADGGENPLYMLHEDETKAKHAEKAYTGTKYAYTFYGCLNIRSIKLPERLKIIGNESFGGYNCLLEQVNIPSTVTYIGWGAFYYAKHLTNITFDADEYEELTLGNTTGNYGVFYCCGLTEITIPKGVTSVPQSCFYGCENLVTVNVPNTITNGAVPSKAVQPTAIGKQAFYNTKALQNLNIASGGKGEISVGESAFYGSALKVLNLPSNVAEWKDYNSSKVNTRYPVDYKSLKSSNIAEINIAVDPAPSTPSAAAEDETPTTPATPKYKTIDGVLYSGDGTALILVPIAYVGPGKDGAIEIPYTVNEIRDFAFYENKGVKTVTFAKKPETSAPEEGDGEGESGAQTTAEGESGTGTETPTTPATPAEADLVIGGSPNSANEKPGVSVNVFGKSAIASITFPARLKTLGAYAFNSCASLETVVFEGIEDKTARLTAILDSTFATCSKLTGISIPASVETIGASVFSGDAKFASVTFVMDGSLTKLGNMVFQNTGLLSVTLPDKVTTLGTNLFKGCTRLTSVSFGDKISSIGAIFTDCIRLNSITVRSTGVTDPTLKQENGVLLSDKGKTIASYPIGKTDSTYVVPAGVTKIADSAFAYNPNLTTIIIPDTVANVGANAFSVCDKLQNVYFRNPTADDLAAAGIANEDGAGVKAYEDQEAAQNLALGNYAFAYAPLLKTVELPERFNSCGTYVFAHTTALETVNIAVGKNDDGSAKKSLLGTIGNYAFQYSGIKQLTIPYGVEKIGTYVFQYSGLTSIEIPSSVTNIGNYAFAYCPDLASVEFEKYTGTEKKTLTVGTYLFLQCPKLTSVKLSNIMAKTNTQMFKDCTALSSVDFQGTTALETIETGTFTNCSALTELNLPDSVKTLKKALDGTGLISFTAPKALVTTVQDFAAGAPMTVVDFSPAADLEAIPQSLFYQNTIIEKVILPGNGKVTTVGASAFRGCDNLHTVTYSGSTTKLVDDEGNPLGVFELPDSVTTFGIYSNGNSFLLLDSPKIKKVILPANITAVPPGSIRGEGIESVVLPSGITEIGPNAFYGSGIKEITIPNTVTTFGTYAFGYCPELTTVIFEQGSNVKSLAECLFYECPKLTNVTLPDSLEIIDRWLFYNCTSLANVNSESGIVLPGTIKEVRKSAFSGAAAPSLSFETKEDGTYSLTNIDDYAFQYNEKLTEITFPNTLTSIGGSAFLHCNMLETAEFDETTGPSQLSSIGFHAFGHCGELTAFNISATVTDLAQNPFIYCSNLVLSVDVDNRNYSLINDMLYNKDGTRLIVCPGSITGAVQLSATCVEIMGEAFTGCAIESLETAKDGFIINSWAFNWCRSLTSVKLANRVTMGEYAFRDCNNLTSFEIGEDCEVGDMALLNCEKLTTLNIPDGTSFGLNVTQGCTGLTSVTVGENVSVLGTAAKIDNVTGKIELIITENVEDNQFKGMSGFQKVTVQEGVTSIGDGAFMECPDLEEVVLPRSLTYLGKQAFKGLKVVDGKNAVYDEYGRIEYRSSLKSINLENTSITSLGDETFYGCVSLASISLPDTLTVIGQKAFAYMPLESFVFPVTVEKMSGTDYSGNQFLYCVNLKRFELPAGSKLEKIPYGCFQYCLSLEELVLTEGITSIGGSLVHCGDLGTPKIKSINIPASVTSIGNSAFTSSYSYKIGSTIHYEYSMPGLTSVTFAEGSRLTTVGTSAFRGTGITSISIPATVETIGAGAFRDCHDLETVTFEKDAEGNCALTIISSGLFLNCAKLRTVSIPKSVTTITGLYKSSGSYDTPTDSAFGGCTSLATVTFEKDAEGNCAMKSIGAYAFQNSLLTSLDIPDSVTTLGKGFVNDTNITEIVLPASLTSIPTEAFINNTKITKVTLPEGLTSIGTSAFDGCTGIKELVVPSTVTNINGFAFRYLGKDATIYMTGLICPLSGWTKQWRSGCLATVVWNYDPNAAAPETDEA